MVDFRKSRLLVSAAYAASGLAILVVISLVPLPFAVMGPWSLLTLFFIGIGLIGAGVGNAFSRPMLGALCGVGLYLVFCLIRFAFLGTDGLKQQLANNLAAQLRNLANGERGFAIVGEIGRASCRERV